ncbi:Ribokinase-like protein [Coniochaeta ligniaria NRRL 30616]|uniref:Ribokinase-like protein n=1 Tax=Coniochaeta ligniaria NRRL 30616 TaxID=1408157 RepID=A0A1J7IJX9_9PEZI|nr:Ribokinase-like protein [Coniochaeta ligniaria NRRL 30616]
MAPQTIAVIGGLDADLIMIASRIPDRGESVLAHEYHEALGGKGANSAIATYRTCHKRPLKDRDAIEYSGDENIQVKMIGAVGDDRYGEKFIVELNKNGVDASGIVTVPDTRSSICFVIVENSTRENRCLFTLGATATWKKENFSIAEQLGGGTRPDLIVAQMEIDKEVVETMIETAGKAGIDFCLNAAPATPIGKRFYRHLTHLLVNESEAAIMSGRDRDEVNEDSWPTIAQEFLNRGVKNVVITLASKGAFYANAKESDHCLADAFTGAYHSDYLRQKAKGTWDIESAVIRANKAAAMTIRSVGAQDGIPWADEIDTFDAPHKIPAKLRSTSTAGIASEASV